MGAWGEDLGVQVTMLDVTRRAAEMQLSIEIGSEPISGFVSVGGGSAQRFRGWIELVATIESARHAGSSESDEGYGALAGASGRQM